MSAVGHLVCACLLRIARAPARFVLRRPHPGAPRRASWARALLLLATATASYALLASAWGAAQRGLGLSPECGPGAPPPAGDITPPPGLDPLFVGAADGQDGRYLPARAADASCGGRALLSNTALLGLAGRCPAGANSAVQFPGGSWGGDAGGALWVCANRLPIGCTLPEAPASGAEVDAAVVFLAPTEAYDVEWVTWTLGSLRRAGYGGLVTVLFGGDMSDAENEAAELGALFAYHGAELRYIGDDAADAAASRAGDVHGYRYAALAKYLADEAGRLRGAKLLVVDAPDVFFQGDPFEFWEGDGAPLVTVAEPAGYNLGADVDGARHPLLSAMEACVSDGARADVASLAAEAKPAISGDIVMGSLVGVSQWAATVADMLEHQGPAGCTSTAAHNAFVHGSPPTAAAVWSDESGRVRLLRRGVTRWVTDKVGHAGAEHRVVGNAEGERASIVSGFAARCREQLGNTFLMGSWRYAEEAQRQWSRWHGPDEYGLAA